MKKILFLVFTFLVVDLCTVMSQDSGSSIDSKMFVGVKGAYGISDFKTVVPAITKFADATFDNISYGVLFGYNLTANIGLQGEVNYSQYSADNIDESYLYSPLSPALQPSGQFSIVDHLDMDLYYIDIPVMVKYTLSKIGFSPYLYAGVNFGINVQGNTTIVRKISATEAVYRDYKDDISARIRYNDIAPVGGIGAKMNLGSLSLLLDIRYKHGFMNQSNVDNNLGFSNKAIWGSVGLVYNL